MERFVGLLGLLTLLCFAFLLSNNRSKVSLRLVLTGVALQFITGFLLLRWSWGQRGIQVFAEKITAFLQLADNGSRFLFGNIVDASMMDTFGFQFAFSVLPIIIFFSAFMAVLYYFGIMQVVIRYIAFGMQKIMGTSGAETLSCTGNIFVGQTEAPLLVRPFLPRVTQSELLTIMVGGFATIAGSVMGAYIKMGVDPTYLIIGSCMAVPGSLMIGKMIYPEVERPETSGNVNMPKLDVGSNLLDAIARGTTDGLHLALNVAAMLIAFIALIAFIDMVLSWLDAIIDGRLLAAPFNQRLGEFSAPGYFSSVVPGSLKTLFGTLLKPLAWLMGVPAADAAEVGHLLGIKISVNEFVGYAELVKLKGVISHKAELIATFALCGFANFSSIGIQIGGLSALAPERREDLARLGLKAMFGGAIVTCMSATIAGMIM